MATQEEGAPAHAGLPAYHMVLEPFLSSQGALSFPEKLFLDTHRQKTSSRDSCHCLGLPSALPFSPMWPGLSQKAHTLPYTFTFVLFSYSLATTLRGCFIITLQLRRLRLRSQGPCLPSTQLVPTRRGLEPQTSGPPVFALSQQHGENSEGNAVSCDSPAPRATELPRGKSADSLTTSLPHSRSTQPELITMAGALKAALTPLEPSEGQSWGCLQNPGTLHPHLWKGPSCPSLLAPAQPVAP